MIDSKDDLSSGTGCLRKQQSRDQGKWSTLASFKDDKLVLIKFNNNQVYNQLDVHKVDIPNENQNYDINEKIKDVNHNKINMCPNTKFLMDENFNNFSDIFNKAFKRKHKVEKEHWELAATGNKETLLQKYYRLKFETEELLQEIRCQKILSGLKKLYNIYKEAVIKMIIIAQMTVNPNNGRLPILKENEPNKNKKLCISIEFQVKFIFEKLSNIGIGGYSEQTDGLKIFETCNYENFIANTLLDKILYSDSKECVHTNASKVLNIIISRPCKLKMDQLLQISKAEKCLHKLEKIIGCEKPVLKHLGVNNSSGLLKDVDFLKKLSTLNLPQVNVIEPRVFHLLLKLEQITTSLNYQNKENSLKINKLNEFILKSKGESFLLPNVIQRMTILETFSHKVESFAVTIDNLKAQHSETSQILKNNEQLLNNIVTHMFKNVENVLLKLHSLNARINVIDDHLKIEA